MSTQGGCDLTTETKSELISFIYSKPVKLVNCLFWIPRIYTLFLGTTLTCHRMPRRGVCDSSAGAWCQPKCHGRLWEHHSPLHCLLPEYITCSKAAFLRRQYRSQEQGISQLTLFKNICKALFQTAAVAAAAAAKSLQLCPTLCDPIDGSPPGSLIPGILQARTLEWVAISFSSAWKWKVKVKSLSRVWLFVTPWTSAYQAPPSMGFSRQE